jgi:hypothetical protein
MKIQKVNDGVKELEGFEMEHGTYILDFGKGKYFKLIYNVGVLLGGYQNIPMGIRFKSPMVNDYNQHLCGGWRVVGVDYSDKGLIMRVAVGLKPFASIYPSSKELDEYIEYIKQTNLDYSYEFREKRPDSPHCILVCRKGTLGELFDLDTLRRDYMKNNVKIDIESVRNKELNEYFSGWDVEYVKPWETGLILCYPIENTISIFYRNNV